MAKKLTNLYHLGIKIFKNFLDELNSTILFLSLQNNLSTNESAVSSTNFKLSNELGKSLLDRFNYLDCLGLKKLQIT
ncbi:hypothetical protein BpHYR1_006455 [Brachionus plicatilis]|uniref:Uncharacterized protein n=1 Tax=Brachionus plicatilis TaxID=10195 RepID=A0A3M7Q1E2_BRAPC|nr:hypothetical protein BpHYR1_006455 [Brachionus plicatilis]